MSKGISIGFGGFGVVFYSVCGLGWVSENDVQRGFPAEKVVEIMLNIPLL